MNVNSAEQQQRDARARPSVLLSTITGAGITVPGRAFNSSGTEAAEQGSRREQRAGVTSELSLERRTDADEDNEHRQ